MKKYNNPSLLATIIFFLVCVFLQSTAHASGFGIFTQGADALGQANATVAHSDGPSSIYFNPALMTLVPGTQIELGTTGVFPYRKFESAADGPTEKNEDNAWFPSTFYLSHQFSDKFSAGLAVFSPFGLGTVWDSDWEGNLLATKSRITTFNINPAVAWRVTPRFAIGAGLDILLLDAKLKNKILLDVNLPLVGQEFSGDGEGVGFNAGVFHQITDGISFGAAYRSEIKIDIDGKAKFDVPDEIAGLVGPFFPDTKGDTSIRLPQQLTAGIAWRISPAWVLETGVRWEDWESFDDLTIDFNQPVSPLAISTVSYPRNWHSTWAYNIGTKYRASNRVALMAGYLYGENPIPDSTFEPAIPDSDTHLFTVGTELVFDRLKLALAYGFQLQENRSKNSNQYGDIANGKYENHIHLAGISMSYAF
ncbi:MAG: outer membrane protein transport protein [Syntrophotaleaceae bacterium]